MDRQKFQFDVSKYGMPIVFCLMFLLFSFIAPNFLAMRNILNVARQISTLGICAVGMTMVLICGSTDLTMGWHISLINVLCATFMVKMGLHPWLAVLLVLIEGTLMGALLGLLVVKTKVVPLILSLGMLNVLNGVSFLVSKGLPIFGFPESFDVIGRGYVFGNIPVPAVIMLVIFVLGGILLKKTYFGRYFYAVGGSEEAAKLSGIDTNMTKMLAHMLCGFLTAVGAVIMLSRTSSGLSANGEGFEFNVITACVLGGVSAAGGKGTISGTLTGVLIVGFLENGLLLMGVSEYIQLVVTGTLMLFAVSYDTYSRRKTETVRKIKAINSANDV